MQEVLPGEAPESAEGQEPDALPGLRLSVSRRSLRLSLLISAASGALLSLALPPAGAFPLAFVALIPFLWVVQEVRPLRGLILGLTFGIAYFGAVLYWILLFGKLAWGSLTLASAGFLGVFGLLTPVVWRRERPVRSAVGIAALWTAIEYVRGLWPLGGFTWGGLGYTQADNRFLLPLASVAGVWGVTFVVALVNALLLLLLLLLIRLRRGSGRRALALGVACVSVVFLPAAIRIPMPEGQRLNMASIQVDVRQARGLDSLAEDRAVAEMNARLDQRLAADPPDFVVWGESALDPGARAPSTWKDVTSAIRMVGAPTLAGAVTPGADGRAYNQGLLFDQSGTVVARYSKVHLVPFGEYVPWRRYLGWISALQQIPYDVTPGTGLHTLSLDGLTFGNVICFENSFPSIDRALVRDGAGLLIVTTNNASYGFSAASRQHLIMSRFRAVENARWVVHAAVSGISAFIDPAGRVVEEAGLFVPAILRHGIRVSSARTLYSRFGDWVPWLSLFVVFGLVLLPVRRPASRRPGALPPRPRTLVVLPTYNERDTIERVIGGVLELPGGVDILVVDDGSPDGTGEIVRSIAERQPRVRLVERPKKAGLGSAYMLGFGRAIAEGYDLAVEMDSDLSHDPAQLPRLLASASDHDLVIGSRYVPGGSVSNWSRRRVALSKGGNRYARFALGLPVADATSGFRVFRREVLEHLVANPMRSDGYGFQIELVLRTWDGGFDVGEAPITFREREHGQSKISRRIVLEALWLVTLWGLKARMRPSKAGT